jgi:hypothetical protein
MKFIYAKRPRPQIEFGTASQLDAVPLDAEVLAVCDGALTIRGRSIGSSVLTNQERSALEELITQSEALESAAATVIGDDRLLRRLIYRFLHF